MLKQVQSQVKTLFIFPRQVDDSSAMQHSAKKSHQEMRTVNIQSTEIKKSIFSRRASMYVGMPVERRLTKGLQSFRETFISNRIQQQEHIKLKSSSFNIPQASASLGVLLHGKPAFFLNTLPKASPLNVCILLCIPVGESRNNGRTGKGNHYRRIAASRRSGEGLAASWHNMILAFRKAPSSHGVKRTVAPDGRSASRITGSICFSAAGKRGCIPGCMPGVFRPVPERLSSGCRVQKIRSLLDANVHAFINAEPRGRTLSLKKRTRHRSTASRRATFRSISYASIGLMNSSSSRSCGTFPRQATLNSTTAKFRASRGDEAIDGCTCRAPDLFATRSCDQFAREKADENKSAEQNSPGPPPLPLVPSKIRKSRRGPSPSRIF